MAAQTLTQELVRELLHYNPETGAFTWKARPVEMFPAWRHWKTWETKFLGKVAGYSNELGYLYIRLNNKLYLAHRLAFLYMTGDWPKDQVDHIDGNPANNRWMNLRDVSNRENGLNQKLTNRNASGAIGVSWDRSCNKWRARIGINYGEKHLGSFDDKEKAIAARKLAEIAYGFHPNHGRG